MGIEINILMFGAKGVGKTSTLVSMYKVFEDVMAEQNLDIHLIKGNQVTSNKLNDKLAELKKSISKGTILNSGIQGSTTVEEYLFFLGKDAATKKITLKFKDIPGGFIKDEHKKVEAMIKDSQVIIIPIDTPALIEEKGIYNEEFNKVSYLIDLFKNIRGSFETGTKKHLILFVPLKSEKYLDKNNYVKNDIVKRVEEEYKAIINIFKSDLIRDKVAMAITPIQTIGGIKFSRIGEKDGGEEFIFTKIAPDSTYSPQDTDQPLRYILSFAIKEKLGSQGWITAILASMFGWNEKFVKAIKTFSKGIKEDNNFKILQNRNFCEIED